MMKKTPQLQSQTSEPLIVVEDDEVSDDKQEPYSPQNESEDESPTMNPYLLSPFAREIRKHSLPTPQCSGITASQVRRLSERGETVGPGPRQAEFLATLSTAPTPSAGGRRHSVVTISKVPSTLFGRSRRESVAAFSSGTAFPSRILPNRRESIACPPSTEPRGSVHNLQLDIMDDIVQARKVRMKLWNTSNERVCEVQPLDDAAQVQRYTNSSLRRYSDFVGTTLAPIPQNQGGTNKRRASELPSTPSSSTATGASKLPTTGIVCSNTDLISILSSLSTSSTEINQCEKGTMMAANQQQQQPQVKKTNNSQIDQKRSRLKSNRSNSFDISILQPDISANETTPSNWFAKRHQPLTNYTNESPIKPIASDVVKIQVVDSEPGKVVWDGRSGSLVDAQALGSAIEVFLNSQSTTPDPETPSSSKSITISPTKSNNSCSIAKTPTGTTGKSVGTAGRAKSSWFSSNNKGQQSDESGGGNSCDSSICSTLKDLFVK